MSLLGRMLSFLCQSLITFCPHWNKEKKVRKLQSLKHLKALGYSVPQPNIQECIIPKNLNLSGQLLTTSDHQCLVPTYVLLLHFAAFVLAYHWKISSWLGLHTKKCLLMIFIINNPRFIHPQNYKSSLLNSQNCANEVEFWASMKQYQEIKNSITLWPWRWICMAFLLLLFKECFGNSKWSRSIQKKQKIAV